MGWISYVQRCDICFVFHQINVTVFAAVILAHGAFHFRVAMMPNKNTFTAITTVARHFHMHFCYQRAGGIKYSQTPVGRFVFNGAGNPMGTEDDHLIIWHFMQFFNKNCTTLTQILHHKLVMDYLMTDVDGRTKHIQGTIYDVDCTVNTCAKTARVGKSNMHEQGLAYDKEAVLGSAF